VWAPAARTFIARTVSEDKTLREFEGGYHELLLDTITQAYATRDIVQWVQQRSKQADSNSARA
jgi:alpha-beta hydrolase superfamily lysophospholipase